MSTPKSDIGSKLLVHLNSSYPSNSLFDIKVSYKSTKDAKALHWMDPNDTNGKKMGYLFTQCQPINCRSLAPMQDTPQVKITWGANV